MICPPLLSAWCKLARQRCAGCIHPHSLWPRIIIDRLKAAFTPIARCLGATKFSDGRNGAIGVHPNNTGPHRFGNAQRTGRVTGENTGGQPMPVSFASAITSSSVLNLITDSTGQTARYRRSAANGLDIDDGWLEEKPSNPATRLPPHSSLPPSLSAGNLALNRGMAGVQSGPISVARRADHRSDLLTTVIRCRNSSATASCR